MLVAALFVLLVCAAALRVIAPPGGSAAVPPTTFSGAGVACAPSADATEQVFLDAHATDKDIIVARVGIASVPGVTIDQYLDHERALAQLRCVFPNEPDRWRGVRPEDVPVSFAITTGGGTDSTARLRAVPNVSGIVTPATWNDWVARIDG